MFPITKQSGLSSFGSFPISDSNPFGSAGGGSISGGVSSSSTDETKQFGLSGFGSFPRSDSNPFRSAGGEGGSILGGVTGFGSCNNHNKLSPFGSASFRPPPPPQQNVPFNFSSQNFGSSDPNKLNPFGSAFRPPPPQQQSVPSFNFTYGNFGSSNPNKLNPFGKSLRQQPPPPPPQQRSESKDGGVAYKPISINDLDWRGKKCVGKMISISGMPLYNLKSHEELRWQQDKGSKPPPPPPPATVFFKPLSSVTNPFNSSVKKESSSSPIYCSSFSTLSTITKSSNSPLPPFSSTPTKSSALNPSEDPSRFDLSAGFKTLTGNEFNSPVIILPQQNINQQQQQQQLVPDSNGNPFGVLPTMDSSFNKLSSSPMMGISSIPVRSTQTAPKISSYLSPRRLLQTRNKRFPVRKYDPKCDSPKVAFFEEGITKTYLIPRENPRALLACNYSVDSVSKE